MDELSIDYHELQVILRELAILVQRLGSGDPPEPVQVVARAPFWMKHLLSLLGRAGNMAILCHMIGTNDKSELVSLLQTSDEMKGFLEDPLSNEVIKAARTWYGRVKGPRYASARFPGLPVFNDTAPYVPIPECVMEWPTDLPRLYQGITELANLISTYENYGPPHAPAQGETVYPYQGNSIMTALLPDSTLSDDELGKWISTPMPDAFSNLDHMEHESLAPLAVKSWFDRRPFLDPATRVEFGGPAGIRLGFFLILRMISHAERASTNIQDSPTASSSVVPEAILQYTRRAMIGLTNHLNASIKVLETTSELRKLSANQAVNFRPMLDPDLARDVSAISPLDLEFDSITISSGGPADEGLQLPENKRSPRRMVSAPTLGQRPAVKDKAAAPWRFTRHTRADVVPAPDSIDSASVDCPDEQPVSGPDEPPPNAESSPPAQQPVAKRPRKNSKRNNPGERKGKSREAASVASEDRRSGNTREVEGIELDAMALDDDARGRSRQPITSRQPSRPQSPESERGSSRTREPVNSSFAPPAARNSLWTRVNLSPPASTSTPADQARGADGGTRKRTRAALQNPDLVVQPFEYAGTGLTNVRKANAGPSTRASRGGGKGRGK